MYCINCFFLFIIGLNVGAYIAIRDSNATVSLIVLLLFILLVYGILQKSIAKQFIKRK
jgi:hypothetical protein